MSGYEYREPDMAEDIRHLLSNTPELILALGETKEAVLQTSFAQSGNVILADTPEGPISRYPKFTGNDMVPEELLNVSPTTATRIAVGESGDLPLRDDSVDMIVFSNFFGTQLCHHREASGQFLGEAARVLKTGGYLVSLSHHSSGDSAGSAYRKIMPALQSNSAWIFTKGNGSLEEATTVMQAFGTTFEVPETQTYTAFADEVEPYAAFAQKHQ